MTDVTPPAARSGFAVSIDLRDVVAGTGVLLALAGAAALHWGAALFVAGAGLCALAARLSRA